MVSADRGRLRQVLLNVLTNAAEAAPRGTPIAVGIAEVDDIATVTVRDAGSGIPDLVRGRLFEPFVTTKRGGLGLGLAIAQSMIEAHHGRIVCEASSSGTEVRISIPVEQGPPSV